MRAGGRSQAPMNVPPRDARGPRWYNPPMSQASQTDVVAMRVGGVVIDPSSQVPVLILRGIEEPRLYVPIFIGGLEATAIATVLAGVKMPRPMTHDLVVSVLDAVQCKIAGVIVTRLEGGTFYAEVRIVDEHGGELRLDARPSDAIALALRTEAPIAVARTVIAEAGALAPEESEKPGEPQPGAADKPPQSGEKTEDTGPRSFFGDDVKLEDLSPEDFGKYKM